MSGETTLRKKILKSVIQKKRNHKQSFEIQKDDEQRKQYASKS